MFRPPRPRVILGFLSALSFCLFLQVSTSAAPFQIHRQPLPAGARRGLLNDNTPLRKAPSDTAPVIRKVLRNLSVAVCGTQNGDCAVELRNGTQGWVAASAVRLAPPLPGNSF